MASPQSRIKRLLAANRSEIAIRVFRSAHELGIRTIALYSEEDRFSLHRYKADEAYLIGSGMDPIQAYLNVDNVIALAVEKRVDAIHPGYGFLSESPALAGACADAGILFIGPRPEILEQLGDKTVARGLAAQLGVPILQGSEAPLSDLDEARSLAAAMGYPVMLKAAHGGGGRGMRVVSREAELEAQFQEARRESASAFGREEIFLERFLSRARHLEVQILGDRHGNLVHLYERDCSLQRRHQKLVEMAPALNLAPELRRKICDTAVMLGRAIGYDNAGTVEFLLDQDTDQFYFIEINPRIQVEHTVTEQVTGVDLVHHQILIAQGLALEHPEIGLASQSDVQVRGYACQCRVTTEDPENSFIPDYGRILHYRSAAGAGIRLDAGTAFSGATVIPFYDSLLVKVTAWGLRFPETVRRMERCLQEFRIRGVKTNIPFLINLVDHPEFRNGHCTTRFIDENPELFRFPARRDRATRLLRFLGNQVVNETPVVREFHAKVNRRPAPVPWRPTGGAMPEGHRFRLLRDGPRKFADWVKDRPEVLITDTTFRDAHQSLLATRMRTYDMSRIADVYAHCHSDFVSLELWGGATFDTAMRFLRESPWDRLDRLRHAIPNIPFQMLLRASNALGYSSYPDNVVHEFVRLAAESGIDIFRIFDSLNDTRNMQIAIEAVVRNGGLAEAAICYTGDILDPDRSKYALDYYLEMSRDLERMGAHILAIKDMAGLCKPYAAYQLIRALKNEVGLPIHFHTHDTSGGQMAALLKAVEAGADIVDAAMAPLAGLTSQPSLNTFVEMLRFSPRDPGLDTQRLEETAHYWEVVRQYYCAFESTLRTGTADVYKHQMPGGQYTNLYQQAAALGLEENWPEVWRTYARVNELFGDIVKVTPSSKVVGDLALFMLTNDLSPQDLTGSSKKIDFPESVIDFFQGRLGTPKGGFPARLRERILGDLRPIQGRPGESLPPADLPGVRKDLEGRLRRKFDERDTISYLLYPQVFQEFIGHQTRFGDVSVLPTPVFFYGMEREAEVLVELEPGKTLIIKLMAVGEPDTRGNCTVFFELNGVPREVQVPNRSVIPQVSKRAKADPGDPLHVGAPMPGMVISVSVSSGAKVAQGEKLLTLQAMKMELTLYADREAEIEELLVEPGDRVNTKDLLLTYCRELIEAG